MKKEAPPREEKGITLIALVITIIILLILAGITIATLTGENGILIQTTKAKEETEIASEKEIVQLAYIKANMQYIAEKDRDLESNMQEELNLLIGENKTRVIGDENELVVKFIESNRYYKVDNKGNASEAEIIIDENPGNIKIGINGENLSGNENSPYEIWCIEDLIEWSQNYSTYESSYINLMQDLSFTSKISYSNYKSTDYGDINKDGVTQTIIEEMKSGIGFIQIKTFAGVFEGNNFSIANLYMYTEGNEKAFLYNNSGTIKNLSIKDSYIKGKLYLATFTVNNNGTIENCKSNSTITGESKLGGIAYNNAGIIKNNIFSGNLESTVKGTPSGTKEVGNGGISGANTGLIEFCNNEGSIRGGYDTGGIVGDNSGTVSKCGNFASLKESLSGYHKGGVVGKNRSSGTVEYCYNLADISFESNSSHGGIVGYNEGNIQYCYNKGNLTQDYYTIGGIAGTNIGTISYCYNTGNVSALKGNSATSTAYGIGSKGTIKHCYNVGKIIGIYSVAYKIAGPDATIQNSYYLGDNTEDSTCKTSAFMQSEEFLDLLNVEENIFIMDVNKINNGYPILSLQDTNK